MEIGLSLTREGKRKWNLLKERYNTDSNSEVFERALKLLLIAVEINDSNGGKLFGIKNNTRIDIVV
jgi:hypothetical protein